MIASHRRGWVAAIVLMAFCARATQVFAADDAGLGSFFRDALGIGAEPQAAPSPVFESPAERPVTIRRKRIRTAGSRQVKIAVGPVAPVSIYDDRTLRAGDAVMTKTGLRVFIGGHGAPYSDADFAALSDTDGLPRQVQKELVALNKGPHG